MPHPDVYHKHRLEMGIPEGVDEIPVGSCFPLEYNLDYMNGGNNVHPSYSKGNSLYLYLNSY